MAAFQQKQPEIIHSIWVGGIVLLLATPLALRMHYAAALLGVFCFSVFLGVWSLAVAASTRDEMRPFPLFRALGDLLLALLVLGMIGLIVFALLQLMLPPENV